MDFQNKNTLVCGMARSGVASAKLLNRLGAHVTLQDIREADQFENEIKSLKEAGITLFLGKNPDELVLKQDLIVLSPGIPCDLPFVEKALDMGVPVWGEIELAYRLCKGSIIAITGTNGKTTTTALCYEMIQAAFPGSQVVGNIGIPFTEKVLDLSKDQVAVAEISSFQLETTHRFKPQIAAVLNVTPDHLNRHKTMEHYTQIKERVFENQTNTDFTVLNYDDECCRAMALKTKGKVIFFSRCETLAEGVYLEDENIRVTLFGFDQCILNIDQLQIFGHHNIDNVLAAVAMAFCAHTPIDIIISGLQAFKGVEHRIEYVTEINGVSFYNDSKATNTDAAIKSIEAIKAPIVLICGGHDKNADFTQWVKKFDQNVRHVVVLGEVSEQIIDTCRAYNYENYDKVNTLKDAVLLGFSKAKPGDCVLLSPACASFDMFDNYEQRGNMFKAFVWGMRE